MSRPFTVRRGVIRVRLSERERGVLRELPLLLESVGEGGADPAAERLAPAVYPADPAADDEWRRFVQPELDRGRDADRAALLGSLGRDELTPAEAEGWLRTLGEARLVLGARLGITEDGWSSEDPPTHPARALLHYLSWLQEELVGALSADLPAPQ